MVLRSLFGGSSKQPEQPEAVAATTSQSDTESIRRIAGELDALPVDERRFIAGFAYVLARNMAELYGATDDYVVTRSFAENSTREQRESLLRTAFAVGAADDTITAAESAELNEIGKELGFRADEIDAIRDEFRDQLAAIQAMRRARGA
jgi:hypothetical protein